MMSESKKLSFTKMHGLGNDFIIIDATKEPFFLKKKDIESLSDRNKGIGFDQLLIIEKPIDVGIDFNYRIFNADGSEVEHCGNGARCFGKYVYDNRLSNKKKLIVKVKKGIIEIEILDNGNILVDMGKPSFKKEDIPLLLGYEVFSNTNEKTSLFHNITFPLFRLTKEKKALKEISDLSELSLNGVDVGILSLGNPHIVFIINNLKKISINTLGMVVQNMKAFPKSINVGFAEIDKNIPNRFYLRVYERGVGETMACGTGACAAAYVLYKKGIVGKNTKISLLGGELGVNIEEDVIKMEGPATKVFDGTLDYSYFNK